MKKWGLLLLLVTAGCSAVAEPLPEAEPAVEYEAGIEEETDKEQTAAEAVYEEIEVEGEELPVNLLQESFASLGPDFAVNLPEGSSEIIISSHEVGFEMPNWDEVVSQIAKGFFNFLELAELEYSLRLENSADGMVFLMMESDGRIYDFTSSFTEVRVTEVLKSWLGDEWEFEVDVPSRAITAHYDNEEDGSLILGNLLSAVNDLEMTFGYSIFLEWRNSSDELLARIEHHEVTYSNVEGKVGDADAQG